MKKLFLFTMLIFFITKISAQQPDSLGCFTMGNPNGSISDFERIGYSLDNNLVENNGCGVTPAIIVAVIDSFCNPWNTCDHNFGQLNTFTLSSGDCSSGPVGTGSCRSRPENYFIFLFNVPSQLTSMENLLNSVPNGYYILAYTWYTYPYSITPNFASAFQSLGASLISTLPDNNPYIFFIRKNDQSTIMELAGNTSSDSLELNATLNCSLTSVSEISNFTFRVFPSPADDYLFVDIKTGEYDYGIFDLTGKLIIDGKTTGYTDKINIRILVPGSYLIRLKNEKFERFGVIIKR